MTEMFWNIRQPFPAWQKMIMHVRKRSEKPAGRCPKPGVDTGQCRSGNPGKTDMEDFYRAGKLPKRNPEKKSCRSHTCTGRCFCFRRGSGKDLLLYTAWRERTGKSVLLRNIACAARDMGGRILFFDNEKESDKATAELTGAEYASTPQQYFDNIKEMINVTNERAPRRKELQKKVWKMKKYSARCSRNSRQSLYVLQICRCFLQNVYTEMEGIGKLSPWIENIFAKGRLLNVFIFQTYNVSQSVTMMDKIAYLNFNNEKEWHCSRRRTQQTECTVLHKYQLQ